MDVGSLGVTFLDRVAVAADGNSPSAGGCDRVKSLAVTITAIRVVGYTTVAGDRQTQIAGNETVTVTVQHSDDDAIWVDADAHEFDNDDEVTITLTSPKAYVRVSWALAGDNPQPILTATAVAAGKSQDQIGAPGGGSQPPDPSAFEKLSHTTTVPDGVETPLGWSHDGGQHLLDLTDPLAPLFVAAGLYAVTAIVNLVGAPVAGKTAQVTLTGASLEAPRGSLDLGRSLTDHTSLSVTWYWDGVSPVAVTVVHDAGSDQDFSLDVNVRKIVPVPASVDEQPVPATLGDVIAGLQALGLFAS